MTDNDKYQQQMQLVSIQDSPYNNEQVGSGNHTITQQEQQLSSHSPVSNEYYFYPWGNGHHGRSGWGIRGIWSALNQRTTNDSWIWTKQTVDEGCRIGFGEDLLRVKIEPKERPTQDSKTPEYHQQTPDSINHRHITIFEFSRD
jgi:hypothetical protein